jgi:hypothetical protein
VELLPEIVSFKTYYFVGRKSPKIYHVIVVMGLSWWWICRGGGGTGMLISP